MASVPFTVAAFVYVASAALGLLTLAILLVYGEYQFCLMTISWIGQLGSGIVLACGKPRIAYAGEEVRT